MKNGFKLTKRILSLALSTIIAVSCMVVVNVPARAAFSLSNDVKYTYSTSVQMGKIRYIAQQNSSGKTFSNYFYSNYWADGNAKAGCFVASTSMALSYMGVNMTPKTLKNQGLVTGVNVMAGSANVASKASSYSGYSISSIFANSGAVTSFAKLDEAINYFQNGNGYYSPPIVWTKGADGGTHYFLVTRKISDGMYEMVDPISESNKKVNLVSYSTNIVYGNGGTAKGKLSDVVQYKRSGAHTHSYSTGYDSAHPHKQYKKCSTCGYSYYTGNTRTVSSCSQCNPTYTVRYYANGGSGAPASSSHRNGNTHTVSSTIPTRFGYTFLGWSTSSSATSATYVPGNTFTVNGNKSLYAVWSEAQTIPNGFATVSRRATILEEEHCVYYTITPDKTRKYRIESTGNIDSKVAIYNSSGTELASNDDGADNYQFRLDYTFSAGTKYYIKVFAYGSSTGAIPFSVKKFYKITYNANGGSGAPSSQERMAGETVSLRTTTPTRSGYRFLGWGTSSTATSVSYNAGSSYSANNDVTLYAVWSRNATPPATPKAKAVNTVNGMKVTWNSVSGATKYVVYKRLGTSSTWDIVATTTGLYYNDNNTPLEGSYYVYSIKAYNAENLPSEYIKANTAVVQRVVAPKTKAVNTTSGINVTWNTVSGATKYIVYRRLGTGTTWEKLCETTGTSYHDYYVTEGIYYLYSVRAVNGTGYSEYDVNKRAVIQHIIAPYTHTRNRATEFSWVEISWDSVPGATKYAVYRRSAGQTTWVLVGYTTDLYLDDYGTKSNYYCYSVRAYNGTGYSAYDSSKTSVIKSWGTYA